MVCKNCGYEIPENENICPNCGCDCDKKDANNDIRTLSDASDEKTEITMPDADWRKEYYIGSGEEQKEPDENQHVFPTMTQRGTDEGLPDMDLGKTTRYFTKKRTSSVPKTRWEKLVLKFRPKGEVEPMQMLQAANKNAAFSVFLDIIAFICFSFGATWIMDADDLSIIFGLFSVLGVFISVVSIDFSDTASDYYKKFYKKDMKRCSVLSFFSHAMFWATALTAAGVIAYKLFLMTGFLQAAGNRFIIW